MKKTSGKKIAALILFVVQFIPTIAYPAVLSMLAYVVGFFIPSIIALILLFFDYKDNLLQTLGNQPNLTIQTPDPNATYCHYCKTAINPDAQFCPKCGKKHIKEVACDNCGNIYSFSNDYCDKCGAVNPEPIEHIKPFKKGLCYYCKKPTNSDSAICTQCLDLINDKTPNTVRVCHNCETEVNETDDVCPQCQTPITRKILCKNCKTMTPYELNICVNCGRPLNN